MKKFVSICAVCLALASSSCSGPYAPSAFTEFENRKSVCFMVGHKEMIDFSSGEIQYSFNNTRHQFRAGCAITLKDESSGGSLELVREYYVLNLEAVPADTGQKIKGKATLCTASITRDYEAEFEVIKKENSLFWLWDDKLKLGVVINTGNTL